MKDTPEEPLDETDREPHRDPPVSDEGPYELGNEQGNDEDWQIKNRLGKLPNKDEEALETRLTEFALVLRESRDAFWLKRFRYSKKIRSLLEQAKSLANSALVYRSHESMAPFDKRADTFEERMCRDIVRPYHRSTVAAYQVVAFLCAIAGAGLALIAAENEAWLSSWKLLQPASETESPVFSFDHLFLLFFGACLGRCVGLLLSFYAELTTVSAFRSLQDKLARPFSAALNDLVMAIVAYLVFSTGFFVLNFGGSEGMSSENVDNEYAMAIVFGLVVGIARAAFLQSLSDKADQASKPTEGR